jgi:hypothetical protein
VLPRRAPAPAVLPGVPGASRRGGAAGEAQQGGPAGLPRCVAAWPRGWRGRSCPGSRLRCCRLDHLCRPSPPPLPPSPFPPCPPCRSATWPRWTSCRLRSAWPP